MSASVIPPGWKMVASTRYPTKMYYFNMVTGESVWELPTEMIEKKKCASNSCGTSKSLIELNCNNMKSTAFPIKNSKQKLNKELNSSNTVTKSVGSSRIEIKPPTAIVAPVLKTIKRDNDEAYGAETLDPVLLKRKLEELFKIQEENENQYRQHKKKKSSENEEKLNPSTEKKSKQSKKRKSKQQKLEAQKSASSKSLIQSNGLKKSLKTTHSLCEDSTVNVNDTILEDIEMLDVSADLTNIDDLPSSKDGSSESLASYYIVVDTNVLISQLSLIDEIKDTPVEGCGPPHIFIPWIVIQELDNLKNRSTKNSPKWRGATEAVRYLNKVLKAKHPRFHGQSPQEVEDWAKTYSKCNDDRILECCISLGNKMPREKVILLTNDKNLSNKALICDVLVHTWDSMMKALKTDVTFKEKTVDKKTVMCRRKSDASQPMEESIDENAIKEQVAKKKKLEAYKQEIETLMCHARQCLKDVLEPFLEAEMKEAYGDAWTAFSIERKLLKGILDAVQKYWKTVFSFHFSAKDKRKFESLQERASALDGFFGDKNHCLIILSDMEDIFLQIKRRWSHINPSLEKIQNIRSSCVKLFQNCDALENSISSTEFQSVLALFQHNWNVLNHLCGTIMDFCQLPHDIPYERPSSFPPEDKFCGLMCNLYPAVHQIKLLMNKMINIITKDLPPGSIFKNLLNALKSFVPSLEIEQQPLPSYPSVQALEKFCFAPQNRNMMTVGCSQINEFHSNLEKALKVLMCTKVKKKQTNEDMICD